MGSPTKRPCPSCRAEAARPLFIKAGWEIVECSSCLTAYTSVLPSDAELEAHYSLDYFKGNQSKFGYVDYAAEEPFNLETFQPKAARLRERHPDGGRVLDVGCATGGFLGLMGEGWDRRGVELSAELVAASPPPPGVNVWVGRFEDYPENGEKFDAVTLWDALDHVPDPRATLVKARRLIKPGGTLAITQGDRASLFARLLGRRWHIYIPPTHLTWFTRESLTKLLEDTGFSVEEARYEGKWVPLSLCFFRLSYILTWPVIKRLSDWMKDSAVGRLKFYVNLFDVVTLYARAS
jgi:SAM-dependent methyltransferase